MSRFFTCITHGRMAQIAVVIIIDLWLASSDTSLPAPFQGSGSAQSLSLNEPRTHDVRLMQNSINAAWWMPTPWRTTPLHCFVTRLACMGLRGGAGAATKSPGSKVVKTTRGGKAGRGAARGGRGQKRAAPLRAPASDRGGKRTRKVSGAPALDVAEGQEDDRSQVKGADDNVAEQSLADEIGEVAAEMEKHIGKEGLSEMMAAEGGGGKSSQRQLTEALFDEDSPNVKKVVQDIDKKLKSTGKTEEELAAEQQRLFDEMRAKLSPEFQQKIQIDDVTERYRQADSDAELSISASQSQEGDEGGEASFIAQAQRQAVVAEESQPKGHKGKESLFDVLSDDEDGGRGGGRMGRGAAKAAGGGDAGEVKEVEDDYNLDSFGLGSDHASGGKEENICGKEKPSEVEGADEEDADDEREEVDSDGQVRREDDSDVLRDEDIDGRDDEQRLLDIDEDIPRQSSEDFVGGMGDEELFAQEMARKVGLPENFLEEDAMSSSVVVPKAEERAKVRDKLSKYEALEEDEGSDDLMNRVTAPFMEGQGNETAGDDFVDDEGDDHPFFGQCNYSYSLYEWVRGCEGKAFPGRTADMTDRDYFKSLEEEGKRYLEFLGLNSSLHPSISNKSRLETKELLRKYYPDDSDGEEDSPESSSNGTWVGGGLYGTAEEDAQYMGKQGATRDWIRAWEGDSSDTWKDDDGVLREKEGGSPLSRLQEYDRPSMLGLVPGSKVGKGAGIGMAPPVQSAQDLIEHGSFGVREYVYTNWGRLRHVPPMRKCMDDAIGIGDNSTGYADLVSDMNWSIEDRIRYNISSDPQVKPGGVSNVHFRKIVSPQEFLETTPQEYTDVPPDPSQPSMNPYFFDEVYDP